MSHPRIDGEVMTTARQQGEAVIASLQGEIDMHRSAELRTQVLDLLTRYAPRKLVLNLEQVPYIDSSALAVLVEAVQKLRKIGGRVLLVQVQPRVRSLLEIARLDSIFVLVGDEREAMEG